MSEAPGASADGSSARYAGPTSIQRGPPKEFPAKSRVAKMRRSMSVARWGTCARPAVGSSVTVQHNANHKRRIRSLQGTAVQREDAAPWELRNRRSGGMVVAHSHQRPAPDREALPMSLVERAKNILLQPKTEWPVIAAEQATTGSLYTGYVIPLALIGPVAS